MFSLLQSAIPADLPLYLAYSGLLTMAVIPIILGSMGSLAETRKSSGSSSAERMAASDAYWFPVIGSAVLFGFYLLFNYFNKDYINLLLTAYFACFGVYAVAGLGEQLAGLMFPEGAVNYGRFWIKLGRKGPTGRPRWQFEVTMVKILSWIAAGSLTVYYVLTKNWIASNILGLAFATSAITLIHLDSFRTGAILLIGLFLYDIFWVFGTQVMVKVAKSFDVPVKLLFPRNGNFTTPAAGDFALLGLGDIVIPGVWIALCHRFDAQAVRSKISFYGTALFGYVLGLLTTMGVMHIFKAAQPALLYLSPACILSVLIAGFINGNIKEVIAYEAEEPKTDKNEKSKNSRSPVKRGSPAKRTNSPVVEVPVAVETTASRSTSPRRRRAD